MVQPVTAAPAPPLAPPRLTVFDTGSEQCPAGAASGRARIHARAGKECHQPPAVCAGGRHDLPPGDGRDDPGARSPSPDRWCRGALLGGPIGILGSVALNFVQELARLGSDTSRPPAPEGMSMGGSEAGVQTGMPGMTPAPGGYTTLATVTPDFLGGAATQVAEDGTPRDGTTVKQVLAAYEAGTLTGPGSA